MSKKKMDPKSEEFWQHFSKNVQLHGGRSEFSLHGTAYKMNVESDFEFDITEADVLEAINHRLDFSHFKEGTRLGKCLDDKICLCWFYQPETEKDTL